MGSEYWQKRFQAVEDMNNKSAQKTVRSITPAFDKAQAQIEKEINAWYARFAKNNQITLVEAKKLLNTKELKEFRWDVSEYIKYGRENAVDQLWMKELENASARFHISRLEALKIRTQNAAEVAFGNELDQIDQMAARVYMDDYYHTAYEIQRGLGIGWDVSQIDRTKLDKILSKPWTADKMTFSDRIWKSKTQLIDSLHTELTQMCVLGKAPDAAINNIAKRMNVSKNQAGRLVMTESAYFGSAAQKDCFNELDVEKFEVVATLDHKTSEVCQDMDGKVFDMKDFEAGVTAPPFHVWCRSCTAPWFEDEDGERAARGADGQTYYVPSSMKYDDWLKSFVNNGSKNGLAPVVDIADLQKQLADKKHELSGLKNEADKVNFALNDWRKGHNNAYYQKYDAMSDDEFQKYVQGLKDKDTELCIELDKLRDDLDYYYDRPDRGTPERDLWDKWKKDNNINLNDLNDTFYAKDNELRKLRSEFNETVGFKEWKSKFGNKTEQDFVNEISDIVFKQQDVQKQIDELNQQIQNALKHQAQVAFDAKDLTQIRDDIIKKHENILKTDVQKQEFSEIINSLDKNRANLYDKMSENFEHSLYYKKSAGWYNPTSKIVEMDLDSHPWDNAMGRNLNGAWKTKFHEEMHQLDHILASRKSPFAVMSSDSQKHAYWAFTHTDTVTGKKLIQAIDDDVLDIINKSIDWNVSTNGVSIKHIKSLNRIPSEAKDSLIRYLKTNYPTAKDRALIGTVTDAIGMTTKGNLHPYKQGFWGHRLDYCKSAGKNGATSEAWADLGGFFLRGDTEALDAVKILMPKTVSVYEGVFNEVIEYAKVNGLSYKP
jgi:SPP1 gp7 family putative phage head morphogenesis protein